MTTSAVLDSALRTPHSALRAFLALVVFSFWRQWRIRQMAWVALGLLAVLTVAVALITHGPRGWRLEDRIAWRYWTPSREEAEKTGAPRQLVTVRYGETPQALNQLQTVPLPSTSSAMQLAATAPFRAVMADERYLDDWAFLNFSRWTVFTMYLGFLLPLFTLAYASGAFGAEREGRTLIWLHTRPLPRWAVGSPGTELEFAL